MLSKFASMISAAFISDIKKLIPIIAAAILGLVLRFYKITEAFPFDHDQEIPAQAAYDFFVDHRISLIGQELSFEGFFLGPLHSWISFIPYGLCHLKPDCVPYFFIAIGTLTIILLYFVMREIFDKKTAIIASAIYAISFVAISSERGASSNFFLFLTSLLIFWSCYLYFRRKDKFLILGGFLAGVATVNFNPVFIFSTVAYFITALLRQNRKLLIFIIAIGSFLVSYTPLVLFNFRHQNILLYNFLNFLNQSATMTNFPERVFYLTKDVLLPFWTNYLFNAADTAFLILVSFLIILGIYQIVKTKEKFLLFLPIWTILPIIGFTLYGGHVPDYYFQQVTLPLIILITLSIRRSLPLLLVVASFFLFTNFQRSLNYNSNINYNIKKQVVEYIVGDSQNQTFNVFYDMPRGLNTGYSYLFKEAGRNPIEGGQNLYILEFSDPTKFRGYKYQISFPNKQIKFKVVGFIHIISVK